MRQLKKIKEAQERKCLNYDHFVLVFRQIWICHSLTPLPLREREGPALAVGGCGGASRFALTEISKKCIYR